MAFIAAWGPVPLQLGGWWAPNGALITAQRNTAESPEHKGRNQTDTLVAAGMQLHWRIKKIASMMTLQHTLKDWAAMKYPYWLCPHSPSEVHTSQYFCLSPPGNTYHLSGSDLRISLRHSQCSLLPRGQNWDLHLGLFLCHMLVCCDHRQKIRSARRNTAPSRVHWDACPGCTDKVPFCEAASRAPRLLQSHPRIIRIF